MLISGTNTGIVPKGGWGEEANRTPHKNRFARPRSEAINWIGFATLVKT